VNCFSISFDGLNYRKIMRYKGLPYYLLLLMAIPALSGCFKSLTTIDVVYENNFETGDRNQLVLVGFNPAIGLFGEVTEPRIGSFAGRRMLGRLNNNRVQLDLTGLPSHNWARVEFDLYLHDGWRNDVFNLEIDGQNQLVTGFSNFRSIQQSYPNWIGNGTALSPAGKNAIDIDLRGACSLADSVHGTSQYHIVTTIPHTRASLLFSCNDSGGALNDSCSRSWSMDNLKVSVFHN
jgi:hypothetical protein